MKTIYKIFVLVVLAITLSPNGLMAAEIELDSPRPLQANSDVFAEDVIAVSKGPIGEVVLPVGEGNLIRNIGNFILTPGAVKVAHCEDFYLDTAMIESWPISDFTMNCNLARQINIAGGRMQTDAIVPLVPPVAFLDDIFSPEANLPSTDEAPAFRIAKIRNASTGQDDIVMLSYNPVELRPTAGPNATILAPVFYLSSVDDEYMFKHLFGVKPANSLGMDIEALDINHDGRQDIAVTIVNSRSKLIYVYFSLQREDGEFDAAIESPFVKTVTLDTTVVTNTTGGVSVDALILAPFSRLLDGNFYAYKFESTGAPRRVELATPEIDCPARGKCGVIQIKSADLNYDGCGDLIATLGVLREAEGVESHIEALDKFAIYQNQKTGEVCSEDVYTLKTVEVSISNRPMECIEAGIRPEAYAVEIAADADGDGLLDIWIGDQALCPGCDADDPNSYIYLFRGAAPVDGNINILEGSLNVRGYDAGYRLKNLCPTGGVKSIAVGDWNNVVAINGDPFIPPVLLTEVVDPTICSRAGATPRCPLYAGATYTVPERYTDLPEDNNYDKDCTPDCVTVAAGVSIYCDRPDCDDLSTPGEIDTCRAALTADDLAFDCASRDRACSGAGGSVACPTAGGGTFTIPAMMGVFGPNNVDGDCVLDCYTTFIAPGDPMPCDNILNCNNPLFTPTEREECNRYLNDEGSFECRVPPLGPIPTSLNENSSDLLYKFASALSYISIKDAHAEAIIPKRSEATLMINKGVPPATIITPPDDTPPTVPIPTGMGMCVVEVDRDEGVDYGANTPLINALREINNKARMITGLPYDPFFLEYASVIKARMFIPVYKIWSQDGYRAGQIIANSGGKLADYHSMWQKPPYKEFMINEPIMLLPTGRMQSRMDIRDLPSVKKIEGESVVTTSGITYSIANDTEITFSEVADAVKIDLAPTVQLISPAVIDLKMSAYLDGCAWCDDPTPSKEIRGEDIQAKQDALKDCMKELNDAGTAISSDAVMECAERKSKWDRAGGYLTRRLTTDIESISVADSSRALLSLSLPSGAARALATPDEMERIEANINLAATAGLGCKSITLHMVPSDGVTAGGSPNCGCNIERSEPLFADWLQIFFGTIFTTVLFAFRWQRKSHSFRRRINHP